MKAERYTNGDEAATRGCNDAWLGECHACRPFPRLESFDGGAGGDGGAGRAGRAHGQVVFAFNLKTILINTNARRMVFFARFRALLLVPLALATAHAEPSPAPPSEPPLEAPPVVVTGTRRESPLKDTPVAIEVVTRKDLEKSGASNAAEALEMHQGLVITSSFRGSGLEVQGLSARHVLILVDGERVTGKVGEELDLSRFPAEAIERIEVVKGAASALYGSDAIGGVVHIVTRKARLRPEMSLDLLHGGFGRTSIATQGSTRIGESLGLSLAFSFRREDPFALDATTPATTASGHEDLSSTLRLTARLSKSLELDTRIQHLYRAQTAIDATALPDDLEGNPRFRIVDRDEHAHTLQLRLAPTFTLGDHKLALSLSSSLAFSVLREDQRAGTTYDRRQVTRETLVSPSAQWNLTLDGHALTAGAEVHLEHLESERLAGAEPDRTRVALYAQDEIALLGNTPTDKAFEPALSLIPGVRLDHDSQFGLALSPRVALRFDPLEALTVRTSFGFGFRAPGFRELYLLFSNPSVGYRVEGNPELAPERSRSAELSFEVRPADGLTVDLTLFRHDLDDLIVTTQRPEEAGEPDIYSYENVSRATSMGGEIRASWSPSTRVRIEVGYGLTDSRDTETDLRIAGRSTHQLTASLFARLPGALDLSGRMLVLGPRPFETTDQDGDGQLDRVQSDWQPLLDLRLARPLGDHLQLYLGLDNTFSTTDTTTLPHRPRSFFLGLTGRY